MAVPTLYQLRAAVKVARALGMGTVPAAAAREAYRNIPTGGLFSGWALPDGEALLEQCGFLYRETKTV